MVILRIPTIQYYNFQNFANLFYIYMTCGREIDGTDKLKFVTI